MRRETEKIDVRLSEKTMELQTRLENFETEHERLKLKLETWQSHAETIADLNSEHFKTMNKNYIIMDKKFELFERVMSEFNLNIEALKTHALSTDLHLESTLPL